MQGGRDANLSPLPFCNPRPPACGSTDAFEAHYAPTLELQ